MRILPAVTALLCLFAGTPAFADLPLDYRDLRGTSWEATEWNGAAPKPEMAPRLSFNPDERFTAFAGCNRHMGRYAIRGEGIAFEPQRSTKMACHGERGATDDRMIADLKRIARLALQPDGALIAHAADGAPILRLRRVSPR